MVRRAGVAVVALVLVATLGGAPAASATPYEVAVQTTTIPTRHGAVYAEIALPVDDGQPVPSPVVLTYSPYGALGRAANRQRWVPDGYVVVFADVLGTGNSGGCFDYGGTREQESAYDVVEWLAEQPWSSGKVAMVGGGYDGATANAAAVASPPSLATIVPISAVSRWYGYSYERGVRYTNSSERPTGEVLGAPLSFGGLALVPPLDADADDWQARVASTLTPCDELAHAQHGYDDTPDYDAFWQERDYLARAHEVDIPVLVASNWGDWTVKASESWDWFHALLEAVANDEDPPQRVLWMGSRWDGHVTPTGGFDLTVDQWLDHHLKGIDNGVDDLARYTTQTADQQQPGAVHRSDTLPVAPLTLWAQELPPLMPGDYGWRLRPSLPEPAPFSSAAQFPGTGANVELHMNHHPRMNHEWFWFESPPLARDLRVVGQPLVQIRAQTARTWVTLTPTIVDVDGACHIMAAGQHVGSDPRCHPRDLYSVTRGFLDTRYRDSLAAPRPLDADEPFDVEIAAKPVDYTFRSGHRIGLQVATEINELAAPKPYPCTSVACAMVRLLWEGGDVRVVLPAVDLPPDHADLFHEGHH